MAFFWRLVDLFFLALAWVAGMLAAVMMVTTFSDVVLRYFFNRPIRGAFEMTEISMGLIVFFALPHMIRMRDNITVTVLYDQMPAAARWLFSLATDIVGGGLCGFIAWRMWLHGERLIRSREVTMELAISKGLVAQTMSVLMAVAALAFLVNVLRTGLAGPRGLARQEAH